MRTYFRNCRPQLLIATLLLAALLVAWSFGYLHHPALGALPLLGASISFNTIPIDVRVPGQYIEFDNTKAVQGLPPVPSKILVVGQRLATGTVLANVPTRVLSLAQAQGFFGFGSMISHMIGALRAANPYTECWAVALDDNAAGVKSTGTITITGPATSAGTLNLYIGGRLVQVAVANADVANTIAASINTAINANLDLDVTSAVALGVVTLTARHKGETGNYIDVRINYNFGELTPAGVGVAIVAMGVVAGAGNPDVATAIAAVGAEKYDTWIFPYTDATNLGKIETELATRWGPLIQKEGIAFSAVSGTSATADTLGAARNSQYVSIMGSGKSPTPPWEWASVVGAVDAFEPDPARPRQTLPLPNVKGPATQDRFTFTERNLLLHDGISTYRTEVDGTVAIERLITTYQTNAFAVDDISYLDVETMRTIAYLRYTVRTRIASKFPRYKLADDGTAFGAGQAVVTPKTIRNELITLFQDWMDAGLAEDVNQFKADLIVQRSPTDPNRVDAVIPPNVINQFRVFAGQVQFRL